MKDLAVFQSKTGAKNTVANSGANLSFVQNVQGFNYNFENTRQNVGGIGSKDVLTKNLTLSPNVNLTLIKNEDFNDVFLILSNMLNLADRKILLRIKIFI